MKSANNSNRKRTENFLKKGGGAGGGVQFQCRVAGSGRVNVVVTITELSLSQRLVSDIREERERLSKVISCSNSIASTAKPIAFPLTFSHRASAPAPATIFSKSSLRQSQ